MADNSQKTPLTASLGALARQAAKDAVRQLGLDLPCSVVAVAGQIVTVKFEVQAGKLTLPQVTMPIATSGYDWIPVQIGDKGVARSADTYLGGISGLGGGVASLTLRANLSAMVFHPISAKAWSAPNPNQRVVKGPAGVLLEDASGNAKINLTHDSITLTVGSHSVVLTATGLSINGIDFETHRHTGVQVGAGLTGGPV